MNWKKIGIMIMLIGVLLFPYRIFAATPNHFFSQNAKLTDPDSDENVYMGWNAAVDGDTLVVGVYRDQNFKGTVYIFERDQGGQDNWGLVKQIYDSEGGSEDGFGVSVAIEGDTLVVGEYSIGGGALGAGAVLIFDRNEGGANNWGRVAKITHSGTDSYNAWFGYHVAISGDTVAASAPRQEPEPAIYIFERDEGGIENWGEVKEIALHDTTEWIEYGYALDLDVDTLVVGARIDDNGGYNRGSVYIYSRDQGGDENWGFIKKIGSDCGSDSSALKFGYSVALDGDTLLVGAPESGYSGDVFTFDRNEGGSNNWGHSDTLSCISFPLGIECGYSVAIQGNLALVGAPEDTNVSGQDGTVYVFERPDNSWQQTGYIVAGDGNQDDYFGTAVALDSDVLAIGARGDDEAASGAGAVYVFYASEVLPSYLPLIVK